MAKPKAPMREASKIVADILVAQLGPKVLPAGQIMLTNQKWKIPANQGLYAAVSYISGQAISSSSTYAPGGSGLTETQQILMLYHIQIDLMSYDDSARVLKEIAYMAFGTIAAEQLMEQYGVQVARQPAAFADTSMLEESGRLNRYTTTIAVTQVIVNTNTNVPYYTDFTRAAPPQITAQP